MKFIVRGWQWARSLGRRGRLEDGLDEEMRFHIDQQTEKNVRAGMSRREARRQAMVRFGGLEAMKEHARDEIRPAVLEDAMRDVRHGVRMLRRTPGFALAALLTLGLGIGATAAIFSVVRTVMLEPLPYREPERVVTVWETNRGATARNVIAPANFVAWRERSRTLQQFGMVGPADLAMIIDGVPQEVSGLTFSAELFSTLGVQPAIGRAYTPEEDYGVRDDLIVLSHEFWQNRLGGREVLNTTLTADGQPRTVIGIMPPRFTVVGQGFDFLVPYPFTVDQMRAAAGRGNSYAIARMRDGVSFDGALADMRTLYADLEREFPQRNARRTVMLLSLQEQMVGDLRPALFSLIGAVALVLLVACVNVANLLLARSATRERELGLRTALGARRGRLVRQMLTESLVLSAAGGLAGLAFAAWCHAALLALVGDRIPVPRIEQLTLDVPIVAFTMGVALTTGILFGLIPAFVSTSHARDALRDGGRHGGGRRLHSVLSSLVVAEVALSLVLLAGAGLLLRSFLKLQNVDPGFRAEGVLTATVPLPATRYDIPQADRFFADTLARVSALPGVQSAAVATCLPVPFPCTGTSFWRVDRPRPDDGQLSSGQIRPVSPGFFKTLQIGHVEGRDFTDSDTAESVPVAIVSQELVRQQFPDGNPIGRRIRINAAHLNGRTDIEWTIVGVVGNLRSSLDGPVRQTVFVPVAQRPGRSMTLFVRTAQDPLTVAPSLTSLVHAREPEAPVQVQTLDEVVGRTIAQPRAVSLLVAAFAILALVLAAVGVYGVMAYSVRERTQEIGIRMALGATAWQVFGLVIGQALRLVVFGVAAGLVAAGLLTQLLKRMLFEVQPLDAVTFGGTAALLLLVAALASYLPARRGMRLAPVEALRRS
jgi:putative ABC transport system permease protein